MSALPSPRAPPSHILILGSGVFALSTLHTLLSRPLYSATRFTIISPSHQHHATASWDSTRIVRADYSDPAYASLAAAAQDRWRQHPWSQDYVECGLLLSSQTRRTAGLDVDYVGKALATTRQVVPAAAIESFDSKAALSRAMRAPGAHSPGDRGYVNRQSGYADAGGALDRLRARLAQDARVSFVDAEVEYLLQSASAMSVFSKPRIAGAYARGVGAVYADVTILATGAWTPALVDMRGLGSCTAQCMLYVSLTEEEAQLYQELPVCIDFSEGRFFFPPTKRRTATGEEMWEIKVARHAFGYANPTIVSKERVVGKALAQEEAGTVYVPSLPCRAGAPIPDSDARKLLGYLDRALPRLELSKTLKHRHVSTRLCHYLDTTAGDFIVSPHPEFDETSFMVMTGDSGHGFKFLPKLGDVTVDVLEQVQGLRDHGGRKGEVEGWRKRWNWPLRQTEDFVWCADGSRSGEKGLQLPAAFDRSLSVKL